MQIDFDKWYEENKEALSVVSDEGRLREAYDAGVEDGIACICIYCNQIECIC